MKHLCFFVFILAVFTVSQDAYSQGYYTVASAHHLSFENRAMALGQATAVLNNHGSYHLNPAIPYKDGELGFSSFLPSFKFLTIQRFPLHSEDLHVYNPNISFGINKWSFSASYDFLDTYELEMTNWNTSEVISFKPNYYIIRGNVGYQISNDFSVGFGMAHIKDFQGYNYDFIESTFEKLEFSGLTYSLGGYYNSEFGSDNFRIKPLAGLAITNIGKDFEPDGNYASMPPAQIRLGLGVEVSHKKKLYNQSVFSLGLYTGFSKYLSRREENGNRPTGFGAIFTTWNSYQRFDGIEFETITVGDQISKSIGIEAGFLETLYIRFGTFGGAELWVRPQTNFGVALDFYYLTLSYADVHYNSTNQYSIKNKNQSAFQMQVRIPLNGNGESNLLSEIF